MPSFDDLQSFARFLEQQGELKRVSVPVSSQLEITEINNRVLPEGGPALLFENVEGSQFPLLINMFGSARRIEWALGRSPESVGRDFYQLGQDMMPPRPAAAWKHRNIFLNALKMKPNRVSRSPVLENSGTPDLSRLPVLTCWPEDGGPFMTLPLVFTQHPEHRRRNIGLYRLQVHDKASTGMHWQIERGGGFHFAAAEERGDDHLPVTVVLGTDPLLMLAGMFPLPEEMDELAFTGFLRGRSVDLMDSPLGGNAFPAQSEIVLEGLIPVGETKMEGPFGDHFGHYSQAAPYPVFKVQRMHHRSGAIYPATVVGKPPQEDKYMGNMVQEMFLPLLKLMHPALTDLWTYFEAGFHNLAVVSVKQRYKKEALKVAFALLGQGQMSLCKCLILVDPDVEAKNFPRVLESLGRNFDPARDFLLFPGTSQDTLDFTSFTMNLGSKMILDATSYGKEPRPKERPPVFPDDLKGRVSGFRVWKDSLLVLRVRERDPIQMEKIVQDPRLGGFALIAFVSEDIPLDNDELLIWGIFTRFDCARDLIPASVSFKSAAWPVFQGPLGVDATWKSGYPKPLEMDPDVVKKVDQRWREYGF